MVMSLPIYELDRLCFFINGAVRRQNMDIGQLHDLINQNMNLSKWFCDGYTFFLTIIRMQCIVNNVISFLLQYLKIVIGFGGVLHYERICLKPGSNWRPPCQCIIFGVIIFCTLYQFFYIDESVFEKLENACFVDVDRSKKPTPSIPEWFSSL